MYSCKEERAARERGSEGARPERCGLATPGRDRQSRPGTLHVGEEDTQGQDEVRTMDAVSAQGGGWDARTVEEVGVDERLEALRLLGRGHVALHLAQPALELRAEQGWWTVGTGGREGPQLTACLPRVAGRQTTTSCRKPRLRPMLLCLFFDFLHLSPYVAHERPNSPCPLL